MNKLMGAVISGALCAAGPAVLAQTSTDKAKESMVQQSTQGAVDTTGSRATAAQDAKDTAVSKKKAKPTKKAAAKPPAERSNKKAEVIAMMKRAKGATLTEIMELTAWQKHTVRGFVSILGSKGVEKVESSKNAAGERVYKIGK